MTRKASSISQHGVALLGLLFALVTIGLGVLLSAWTNRQALQTREQVTQVALQQAKDAVIGFAATQSIPGRLPCPENTGSIGTPAEGQAQGSCSTPASRIGRLPWRTLHTGKLLDGNGTELWYAVSPGFASAPINNTTIGQLNVDGVANAAVAIIIAPCLPLAGQQRTEPTAANPPQAQDYLDLTNSAGTFVSGGPAASFNDRILIISHADLFNAVQRTVLAEVRGLDDQSPGLPVRGLRRYFTDYGSFPWAATPGSGSAVASLASGSLPYNDLNYLGNSTWLASNGWLPLVTYTRTAANQAQIQLGTSTMTVLPCTTLPCP